MSSPCQPYKLRPLCAAATRPRFPGSWIVDRRYAVEWSRAGRRPGHTSRPRLSSNAKFPAALRPASRLQQLSKTTGRPLRWSRALLQDEQLGGGFMQTYSFYRNTTRTDIVTDRQVLSGGDSIPPLFINASFVYNIGQLASHPTLPSKEKPAC
jgi:hypothetical protein